MIRRTKEELLLSLLTRLKKDTPITDIDPGTIARTFCELMAEEFNQFYQALDLNLTMSFVSTAVGKFLDLIGQLLNCTRLPNETDANYRSRIVNQVYVIQGSNYTAVRLKALSIDGVRDIVSKQFTRGTGSFSLYVITDDPITPQAILNQVEEVIEDTKAYGIYAEVKAPKLVPVSMKLNLVFSDKVTEAEKSTIRQSIKQVIKSKIDNLGMGSTFSVKEMVYAAIASNTRVVDADISVLKIKEISQFTKNFTVSWNERIVLENLEVA